MTTIVHTTGECSLSDCFCHEAQKLEQQLTVEQCLAELRETLLPYKYFSVSVYVGSPTKLAYKISIRSVYYSSDEWSFRAVTLPEAMDQVRKWRKEQQQ